MLLRMGPVGLKPMVGVAIESARRVMLVAIMAVSFLWVLICAVRDAKD